MVTVKADLPRQDELQPPAKEARMEPGPATMPQQLQQQSQPSQPQQQPPPSTASPPRVTEMRKVSVPLW